MKGLAVVDWLSFTFDAWHDVGEQGVLGMIRCWLREWLQEPIAGEEGNGLYGFSNSVTFYSLKHGEEVVIGVAAWGGKNQAGKVYLSINGTGCSLIKDWHCVRRICESVKAKITRLDLAVDAVNGEFTTDDALQWYADGLFNRGGRTPKYQQVGPWRTEGALYSREGRTLYVGVRGNGKFARIYEKGKQLGDSWSVWNRFEVELGDRDRVIPYDAISNPTPYFAGAYPCCESIVDVGASRIATLQEEMRISLARLKSYCRIAYGKLIHVLRIQQPDNASELLDELAVEGIPRRLVKPALSALSFGESASPPIEEHQHG